MNLILTFLCAYAIGSIPFGVLVARAYGVDIMGVGSGNTGATNVWRAIGWKPGLFVFVLDVAKGTGPTLLARLATDRQELWFAVGIVSVLGHSFSPFLKFRGGKGVSTFLGAMIGTSPLVAASGFGVFVLVLLITRFVSLASLIACASTVAFSVVYRDVDAMPFMYAALTALLTYRHRANIGRLVKGTEPKFSFRGGQRKSVSPEVREAVVETSAGAPDAEPAAGNYGP